MNLINSFKSRCFDLLCLGFWERPSQTFKSLAYDSGKSHQIYVVFNGEVIAMALMKMFIDSWWFLTTAWWSKLYVKKKPSFKKDTEALKKILKL